MNRTGMLRKLGLAIVLATALASGARVALAQDVGRGFLFGAPEASFVFRGGLAMPNAGSDVFTFATSNLTLGKSAFNAAAVGAELQVRLSPRTDWVIGVDFAGSHAKSEFRNWVDNNNRPIEQFTALQRMPITMSLKYYLVPNGRTVGRFAWIPTKFTPYIGAGGGFMWYSYKQDGDFIDLTTKNVFADKYESDGWTPSVHAFGGVDYSLSPRYAISTELRYTRASANLGSDFSGFGKIDLSGVATNIGIHIRF
jgi:outer membrane protein W